MLFHFNEFSYLLVEHFSQSTYLSDVCKYIFQFKLQFEIPVYLTTFMSHVHVKL